jgi:aspartate beta-hydroxylase
MNHGAWDVFNFYERGRRNETNRTRCPTISRIIDNHDTLRTLAGVQYASRLSPGAHIRAHRGPTNIRMRCHLGIHVPDGDCAIRVGDQTQRWHAGRCLVFDDSFEHEAWNHTEDHRIVLIVDVWHPDLTPVEIAFLEGLHRYGAYQADSLSAYWAAKAESDAKARKLYD